MKKKRIKEIKTYLHLKCKLCGGKMYMNHTIGKVEIVGGETDCKAHPKSLKLNFTGDNT